MPGTPVRPLLLALLVAAPAGGAVAIAQLPNDTGVIRGCVRKDGHLRLATAKRTCRKNERPISWNVRGPKGPKGDPGTVDSLERLNGVACRTDGHDGTVELSYDGAAQAVFTCVV